MSGFSAFSDEEKLLTVSIPYRVGLWISNAEDNENTKYDDKHEARALEAAIQKMAGQKKQPFAATIANHILNSKKAWRGWATQIDEEGVLAGLAGAIETGKTHLSPEQVSEYKKFVWYLALAVARSFGEHVDPDNEMHVNRFFTKLFGGGHKMSAENISEKEKTALKKLQAVLKD